MTIDAEGRVIVAANRERIAEGPFARLVVASVVVTESNPRAERGRQLARNGHVRDLGVETGLVAATVVGDSGTSYRVELRAEPVPPRVWSAVAGSVAGRELLQAALDGRPRAVQLEHTMTVDWDEPLVPHARAVGRSCTCADWEVHAHACKHIAATAYALAYLIDGDVSLLLRWRGCDPEAGNARHAADTHVETAPAPFESDPWATGPIPEIGPARPLPVGAVVKRLGRSGIRVGGDDLAVALERAYAAFASGPG